MKQYYFFDIIFLRSSNNLYFHQIIIHIQMLQVYLNLNQAYNKAFFNELLTSKKLFIQIDLLMHLSNYPSQLQSFNSFSNALLLL